MLSITYISSAVRPLQQTDLVRLLTQARTNNARSGLTGMLLYKDGNIMQAIEGEAAVVRALFKHICADDRHRGVITLLERAITEREFPDWTMGFQNLSDPAIHRLQGYSEFMNLSLDAASFTEANHAVRLLQVFRQKMVR